MRLYFDTLISKGFRGIAASKAAIFNGVIIGTAVGCVISIYDWLISEIIINVKSIPPSLVGLLPIAGMMFTGLIVHLFKIKRTSMADEIVYAYHSDVSNIELSKTVPKLIASVGTLSLGASAGLEGASKWAGAITGISLQKMINSFPLFKKIQGNLTIAMMTGASAGIAAIFKAPLSGTIMALESPYKKDLAHEPMVQSFIGAVSSYAIFTALRGSHKFFLIDVKYTLKWQDILISLLIGAFSGLFSLGFLKIFVKVQAGLSKIPLLIKYCTGGILISLVAYIGFFVTGDYVTMFGGNEIIANIFLNKYGLNEAFTISLLKALATILTFAFGGIGGFFLPSATIGACLGLICQFIFHFATPGILPFIGIASFIAASYNGLLFGPILIAEITGESSLVVLGIISSTIAYLISNGVSNSSHQKDHR